ncbi:MAG: hypothetical protein ACRD4F_11930, partial [Candidatus Angelobacter sp.]
ISMLLLLLAIKGEGQKPRVRSGDAASCVDSALLSELSKASGTALLSSYGYNLREPWACAKINSPWAGESTLLHFQRVTAQSDDETAFSVMKVAGISHIWVIPTEVGMLEAPHAESDPHNLAAFNALLQTFSKAPSSAADWNAVGKLYMALLGHKGVVPIEAEVGNPNPNPCSMDRDCSVAFADRLPRANESYTKWTLTFSSLAFGRKQLTLSDASREVVRRSGS